jgi:hypothetical protein
MVRYAGVNRRLEPGVEIERRIRVQVVVDIPEELRWDVDPYPNSSWPGRRPQLFRSDQAIVTLRAERPEELRVANDFATTVAGPRILKGGQLSDIRKNARLWKTTLPPKVRKLIIDQVKAAIKQAQEES